MGCGTLYGIQIQHLGSEAHTSVHPASTPGVFEFHCSALVSVSDTSVCLDIRLLFKPIKDSFGLLHQIGFLVMFGEALLKTIGLCVNLSSYNRKVLWFLKEDVLIRFDIVADSDAPPTTGWIVVLPEVTRGNSSFSSFYLFHAYLVRNLIGFR